MRSISKKTLRQIIDEFPTCQWTDEDLEELVVTKESLISGFQELMHQIEELEAFDLEETGPAWALKNFEGD